MPIPPVDFIRCTLKEVHRDGYIDYFPLYRKFLEHCRSVDKPIEPKMNEEIEVLLDVARRLEKAGISYMMTGSMALAIYSTPRMSRDIDLIIAASASDIPSIVASFQGDFYIAEESVRQALLSKGMFNIIHRESVIKIDLIVRKCDDYRIEEFSRRRVVDVEGTPLAIVAPEDLILSKLLWAKQSGSELQLRDVRQMLAAGITIDREYLERWASQLGVGELLTDAGTNE